MYKRQVFGAGKIARGFIGQLLYLSKADITFVDIDQQLVDRLNKDQKYHVYILGDSSLDSDVTGFQAVQLEDEKRIGAALVEADIAFVSVGGANLKLSLIHIYITKQLSAPFDIRMVLLICAASCWKYCIVRTSIS